MINKKNISLFIMENNYNSYFNDIYFNIAVIDCNFEYTIDDKYILVTILNSGGLIHISKNKYFEYLKLKRKEKLKKIL